MKFSQALELMEQGKKVRRNVWSSDIAFITISFNAIVQVNSLISGDDRVVVWKSRQSDILRDDWSVVE